MSDPSSPRPSVGVLVALVLGLLGILSLLMQNVQLRREVGEPLAGPDSVPPGASGSGMPGGVVRGTMQRAVSGPSIDPEDAWRMEAEEAGRLLLVEIENLLKHRQQIDPMSSNNYNVHCYSVHPCTC